MSSIVLKSISPLIGALTVTVLDCIEIYRAPGMTPSERRIRVFWSLVKAIVAALLVSAGIIFIS